MDMEDFTETARKAIENAIKERGHVNVLIAGRTGVGKSTLINAVFEGDFATTGQGRPITQDAREHSKEGIPLSIIDTRGLEMAAYKETTQALQKTILERRKDPDPNRHIHVAWICIHEDGRRVEQAEIELHEMLAEYMPVIGVITKSRADKGFRDEVQKLLPQTRNVVRVRALEEELDEGQILKPMGLESLVEITMEALPEGMRKAFIASQKVSLELKKKQAHKIVLVAASAAAAAGASPIPFSDAIILVPIQVGMLASISSAFGLPLSTAFLGTLVASAAGTTGATLIGRTIVSNILKFIPGIGSVAGGAISGATAAALTTTLGEVYIKTLTAVMTNSKGEIPSNDEVMEEFKKRFGKKE